MLTASMPSLLRSLVVSLVVAGAIAVSACGDDPPSTLLQPSDFKPPAGARDGEGEGEGDKFDPNKILEDAEFTDGKTIDVAAVQKFLRRTPYERPSFLETYQSNGVRAADAIVSVARQYNINPLVFLVYAQAVQGLIGEREYPFPPKRVEYVFRCGCLQSDNCLLEFAGFDRQLDCLGRAFREAIDQIKRSETTTSGWGPNVKSVTLDDIEVEPENAATAALYDRTPRVAEGKVGGTWIFWNLWRRYAQAIPYSGPLGGADGRWIGEACETSAMCSDDIEGAICAEPPKYPGGFCTVECDATRRCPSQPGKAETFCAKFEGGGGVEFFCLPVCNRAAGAGSCREGYECKYSPGVDGDAKDVCSPPPDK
jgi:hypothetical protein